MNKLICFYDANGQVIAVRYKSNANSSGTYYYYAYNYRGDIIGLYNAGGDMCRTYSYDAWGNILSVKNPVGMEMTSAAYIGNLQSLKYRGYYYDYETGLYYLQSRYYDPVTHRFINADGLVSTGSSVLGYNMFAYCENNPVNYSDHTGNILDQFGGGGGAIAVPISYGGGGGSSAGLSTAIGIGAAAVVLSSATSTAGMRQEMFSFRRERATSHTKVEVSDTISSSDTKKRSVIFPQNPYNFHPLGLELIERPGTTNGKIIQWMDSKYNKEVFRWDENIKFKNGPHYHILGMGHYLPGIDEVPEPFASFYFPFN